jgi:hypothetical protein
MISQPRDAEVTNQLIEFGNAFPFPRFPESDVALLESKRGFQSPPIVRQTFLTIGSGDHYLTGVFFFLDCDLVQSELLLSDIEDCSSRERLIEEEFGNRYVDYSANGNELVIGMTEFLVYFIEDLRVVNPIVRCFVKNSGVIECQRNFSELLQGFRYFHNPSAIPQNIVDWAWYLQHFELNHFTTSIDQYSREIANWAAAGRDGMPHQFQGHPETESIEPFAQGTEFSVFHPDY